jgi:hypothetical protein
MRSDEGWELFIITVIEFCAEHSIDIPDLEATYILRGGRAHRQPDHFTIERYLRVEIFRATIDSQLTELNLRFNEKVMDLLSISVTLIPRHGFTCFSAKEICRMVEKYYPADFTQQERYGLELQLNRFVVDAKNSEELRKPATITSLCHCIVETGRDRIYNWLDRLLRLLVTLPVFTASAERAFSSLKIIKSRLRNRMGGGFLADSMLLQIEREIASKISYEDVIADFKANKNRRGFL